MLAFQSAKRFEKYLKNIKLPSNSHKLILFKRTLTQYFHHANCVSIV